MGYLLLMNTRRSKFGFPVPGEARLSFLLLLYDRRSKDGFLVVDVYSEKQISVSCIIDVYPEKQG